MDKQEVVDHQRVVRLNLAAMTEEAAEAAEKLWAELAKERAHQEADCTEDEAEQEWCQEA